MSTKAALKSIRQRLGNKDYEWALSEANDVLKDKQTETTDAINALIFRGLALLNLDRWKESEKSYLHALSLSPNHPLALTALTKAYTQREEWDELAKVLEVTVDAAYQSDEIEKCGQALQQLLEIRKEHGSQSEFLDALRVLLPSSPLYQFLQNLPVPPADAYTPFQVPEYPGSAPDFPSPFPPIQALVTSQSFAVLLYILLHREAALTGEESQQVRRAKQRIGGGLSPDGVIWQLRTGKQGQEVNALYQEVGSHPGASEEIRRAIEVRELEFWRQLASCTPVEPKAEVTPEPEAYALVRPAMFISPHGVTMSKAEVVRKVDELARGMVMLGISTAGAEQGWAWLLEGSDCRSLDDYDLDLLHKYTAAFPNASMSKFILSYLSWADRELPETEEAAVPEHSGSLNARQRRKAKRQSGAKNEDLEREEREEVFAVLVKTLSDLPNSLFAHRVLSEAYIKEEDWADAIAVAERGREIVKTMQAERGEKLVLANTALETCLGVALVHFYPPKHHLRATRLLNAVLEFDPADVATRMGRGRILQAAGDWDAARAEFQKVVDASENVEAQEEVGWCLVKDGKVEEGREVLETVVELRDTKAEANGGGEEKDRARAWWRLGMAEWILNDDESKERAHDWFVASLRCLETFAPAFTSLGIYYSSTQDEDRAVKCFQRAFELDATETEAAHKLASLYADQEQWELVRAIASRVMEGEGGLEGAADGEKMAGKSRFAPKNGWAWKAMGAVEVYYRKWAVAAQAFQISLRADADDVATWIRLGEAYIKSGRHMAALKAFQQALELSPDNWLCLYYIGDVHSQLASYDVAIETFQRVLELKADEPGVLATVAQTSLAMGRAQAAGGFRERSRVAFRIAISSATTVIRTGRHRPWGWKLIGDASFELAAVEASENPDEESAAVLQTALELLVEVDTDKRSTIANIQANELLQAPSLQTLKVAIVAYAYRSHLLKNEPRVADSALYDLACALHVLALSDASSKEAATKAAVISLRLALERDAGDERIWNALGVVSVSDSTQLAQHAFIVALELEPKNPAVWTNLGFLYFRLNDDDLANECFLKAQTLDPDHSSAWLGQGMLADRAGDAESSRALLAHAVMLSGGALLEADIGYAVTTFAPFLQGPADEALLHQPAFALRRYCDQRPRQAAAIHLHALICERLGQLDTAVLQLERATALLEAEYEEAESPEVEAAYAVALCNLGRVQLAARNSEAALEAFNGCLGLVDSQDDAQTLKTQCRFGAGLAHYWLGQIDEALDAFQSSLGEAAADTTDEVSVMLARTLWGVGGDDAKEAAKGHLLECFEQEKPSIEAITTLAAIAATTEDEDLLDASLSELDALALDRRVAMDPAGKVELLLAHNALITGDTDKARSILQASVHAKPASDERRARLARLLLSLDPEACQGLLQSSSLPSTFVLQGLATLNLQQVQKATHLAPWDDQAWQALAYLRT